jgi:REP element-mobilizing transposase RayT
VAHHVTQRGNGRRFLLESDADRRVYLDLLRENLALHELLLVGYCLMSNHVHLIVIPADARRIGTVHEACARALCVLLERGPQLGWTCLARTILLMSAGSTALHRTESDASATGDRGARLGMVERGCSLCNCQADALLSTELWQNHWTS